MRPPPRESRMLQLEHVKEMSAILLLYIRLSESCSYSVVTC